MVTTVLFHALGGWWRAAIGLGSKIALVLDAILLFTGRPAARTRSGEPR